MERLEFEKKHKTTELLRFSMEDAKHIMKTKMFVKTPVLSLYRLSLLGITIFSGAFIGFYVSGGRGQEALISFFIALLLAVGMIFVHESIHALFYFLLGAKKIKIHGNWKRILFYATADNFVLDGKRSVLVALAPFVSLFTLIYVLMKVFPQYYLILSILMFFHMISCSGDILLVNYFYGNRDSKLYMYDDEKTAECVILKENKKK